MNIVNKSFVSIDEIRSKLNGGAGQIAEKTGSDSGKSFDRVLLDKADQIKFSRHAAKRLESLVMVDDLAFILNVRNKTIVTAVNDTANAVFTNIDGAIIN